MMEGRPVVFRLSAEALAAMFRHPRQLADPTASGVLPADVKRLTIRTGDGGDLTLERDLDRWLAPDSGMSEVPARLVNELLNQLTELRASGVEIRPYPRDMQVAMVTMYGYDLRPLDTVRIARDPQTRNWALDNGDNVLRIFPESMAVPLTAEDFGLGSSSLSSGP